MLHPESIQDLGEKNEECRQNNTNLVETISDCQENVTYLDQSVQNLTSNLAIVNRSKEYFSASFEVCKLENNALDNELLNMTLFADNLTEKVTALENDNAYIKGENEHLLNIEIPKLNNNVTDLESEIEELERKVRNASIKTHWSFFCLMNIGSSSFWTVSFFLFATKYYKGARSINGIRQ